MSSGDKSVNQRRAGQRADELLPGEDSHAPQVGDEATGTPAGGLGSSGLEGLPSGDGSPSDAELSDCENADEPQSGRSGGAVGGTPANKRSSGD
jgi:hypothetical protein